jgi:hypothetical protein
MESIVLGKFKTDFSSEMKKTTDNLEVSRGLNN